MTYEAQSFVLENTAIEIVVADDFDRQVTLRGEGTSFNGSVYVGYTDDVDINNGYIVGANDVNFYLPANNALWAVSATGSYVRLFVIVGGTP